MAKKKVAKKAKISNTNNPQSTGKKPTAGAGGSNITTTTTTTTSSKEETLPPNLLLPVKHFVNQTFSMEEIIPGYIWVVHDFLTNKECQDLVNFIDNSQQIEYVGHPATKYIANRECYRWQNNNESNVAQILFERMKHCGVLGDMQSKIDFPSVQYVPKGCHPKIRLYKYEKGMSFGKHVDGSHPVEGFGQSEATVLVYLSSCGGGATRFYPNTTGKKKQSVAFAPKPGALLVHIHGDRCLEHEADPVESGIKYILRTDVVYGYD